jgi:hypothetical protein
MEVVAAAALLVEKSPRGKIAGYRENGDKRMEYGETANRKRWKNGAETVARQNSPQRRRDWERA